jgi:hypothetical protein
VIIGGGGGRGAGSGVVVHLLLLVGANLLNHVFDPADRCPEHIARDADIPLQQRAQLSLHLIQLGERQRRDGVRGVALVKEHAPKRDELIVRERDVVDQLLADQQGHENHRAPVCAGDRE